MNQYPVGNIVKCMFAFTNRAITPAETDAYLAGNGLPANTGIDQTIVQMDLIVNSGPLTTILNAAIVHDGLGMYHALVTASQPGIYRYRGYSLDGSNNPIASTAEQSFRAVPFQ